MIVAVPLFGPDVAPRFCFADQILVVELVDSREVARQQVEATGLPWPDRLRLLNRHGVELLLCSGFNRQLLPVARGFGINVVWGLCGDVEELLERYRTQGLPEPMDVPLRGRGGGRGGGRGKGRGRCKRRNDGRS